MSDREADDIAMVLANATPDNFINLNLSACQRVATSLRSLLTRLAALEAKWREEAEGLFYSIAEAEGKELLVTAASIRADAVTKEKCANAIKAVLENRE